MPARQRRRRGRLEAKTLSQFVQVVCDIRRRWTNSIYMDPWFRGQEDYEWPLRPSLYRLELAEDEDELRAEFKRKGVQLLAEREPQSDWEWYFLMQHHGAPTRLLDWTDSALVALFFALNSRRPGGAYPTCDAAVWVLDPWWLNRRVLRRDSILYADWEDALPWLPELHEQSLRRRFPVAIDPPHVARRVTVQRSRFTVHGTDVDGLTRLGAKRGARLLQIAIPNASIAEMRVDLGTCGVTDSTLFPDLEGLGRELTRYYVVPP